ncbi:MAG: hypothetical protein V1735_02750 [Nanoarchaeota archaeon]
MGIPNQDLGAFPGQSVNAERYGFIAPGYINRFLASGTDPGAARSRFEQLHPDVASQAVRLYTRMRHAGHPDFSADDAMDLLSVAHYGTLFRLIEQQETSALMQALWTIRTEEGITPRRDEVSDVVEQTFAEAQAMALGMHPSLEPVGYTPTPKLPGTARLRQALIASGIAPALVEYALANTGSGSHQVGWRVGKDVERNVLSGGYRDDPLRDEGHLLEHLQH